MGDPAKVAPFFRFPGLLRQESVEHYLRSKQVMAWSVDFMGDDWRRINAREINQRVLERLEAKGKGILLLHDIQPATALGLAELLRELKARGYRIVHVVPAANGRPATVTTADQWVVRGAPREQVAQGGVNVWPRVLPHRVSGVTTLSAPSVTSFGAETPDDAVPVTLVSAPAPLRNGDGEIALPLWPPEVITIAVLPEVDTLPAPAADNFRYHRINRGRAAKGAKKETGQAPAEPRGHPFDQRRRHRLDRHHRRRQPRAEGRQSRQEREERQGVKFADRQFFRCQGAENAAAKIRAATQVGTATQVGVAKARNAGPRA